MGATIPGWTGAGGEADKAWNTVYLGDVQIPGMCTVNGLSVAVNVDTKTAKGSDQPTSTDNGAKASEFTIDVQLKPEHWPEWQRVLPTFNPRRSPRKPLSVVHPDVNHFQIEHVRVLRIESRAPSAVGGKRFTITCQEWFDAPKPVKKVNKPVLGGPGYGPNTIITAGEGGVYERNRQGALREMSGNDYDFDPVAGKSNDPEKRVAENVF
jgi:hypothetical protein